MGERRLLPQGARSRRRARDARSRQAQHRRRRDCPRSSGRRIGRAHRPALAQRARAHRWTARDGGHLHRWRPGRGNAGRARGESRQRLGAGRIHDHPGRCVNPTRATTMQHWTLARDAEGYGRLTFDKAGTTTNTLSTAVLTELNDALDQLERDPPKGLVIASGKANGFIAGADTDEFGAVKTSEDALALVRRGWDTFERLAA